MLDARMDGLGGRIDRLQWIVGIDLAIGLATLAAVLAVAFRLRSYRFIMCDKPTVLRNCLPGPDWRG